MVCFFFRVVAFVRPLLPFHEFLFRVEIFTGQSDNLIICVDIYDSISVLLIQGIAGFRIQQNMYLRSNFFEI